MVIGIGFLLCCYAISCILVLLGTYIAFKLDDDIAEHNLYEFFTEDTYPLFVAFAFAPIANTVIVIWVSIGLLYYFLFHNRIVKFCKRTKI